MRWLMSRFGQRLRGPTAAPEADAAGAHRAVVVGGGFGGLQATPADSAAVRAILAAAGQPSATRAAAEAPVR